jgi:hypothetical protein
MKLITIFIAIQTTNAFTFIKHYQPNIITNSPTNGNKFRKSSDISSPSSTISTTSPHSYSSTITSSSSSSYSSSTSLNMFTGIIEEMGTVVSLITRPDMEMWDGTIGSGTELTIKDCPVSLDGAYLGCSICVSGVCLTATDLGKEGEFKVGLAPETLRRR